MDPTQQTQQQQQAAPRAVPQKATLFAKFSFVRGLPRPMLLAVLVVIGAGIFTGYFLSQKGPAGISGKFEVAPGAKVTGEGIGLEDTKTFRDSATGVLKKGGIDGEGTHHLEREGGPSQNAYLTSSVINLNEFVDKKVEVWGETFKGQKAGWLMDVGRIKIIE
ncbi:hypothetical protein HYV21_00865 [Candidatus Microgenomates bacterium]|nr:hypothetical protein [Candidatus Microgenomates bacterium]